MLKKFLVIGHCCVDSVSGVWRYPEEDSTVGCRTTHNKCTKQFWERGGNASNNCSVLAALGAKVEFFGTIADDHFLPFFQNDMASRGIAFENCPIMKDHQSPNSVVICSEESGSRTIIHNNGTLPELSLSDFTDRINMDNYSWIHAEGRNPGELIRIVQCIQQYNAKQETDPNQCQEKLLYKRKKLPLSIEVEKVREPLKDLLPFADVAFVGSDFAKYLGAKNSEDGVSLACKHVQTGCLVICPWGETGASYGVCGEAGSAIDVRSIPAFPPEKIVDSLGAGDTFDAAVIYALHQGRTPEDSVTFGCKVAGGKLGFQGFKGITQLVDKWNN